MNEKTLAAARKKMVRTVWEQEPSFKASQLDIALYLSATKTNHDLEAALRLMQSYDPSMFSAMLDLSTASAKQTVHDELKYQAENQPGYRRCPCPEEQLGTDPVFRVQCQPVHQRCCHRC